MMALLAAEFPGAAFAMIANAIMQNEFAAPPQISIGRRPNILTKGQEKTAPAMEQTFDMTVARKALLVPMRVKK